MFRLYVLNSAFAALRLLLLVTMVHEVSLAMGTLLLAQFLMVRRYAALFGSVLQAGVSQYFIRYVPPVAVDRGPAI